MADNDPKKIESPKTAVKTQEASDVIIHVMPKEFLGKPVSVQEAVKPAPVPTPPPPPPKPVPPPAPKKQKKGPLVLILVGVIILLLLGIGGYVIIQSLKEEPVPEPEPTPEPIPEPTPEPEPEPEPEPVITRGTDTDSDGLTDREEALYGTDFRNPDTDGDSFLDGNEVFHRFDPLGFAPSTLLDTGSVVEYTGGVAEDGGELYRLTYPRTWTITEQENGFTMQSATSARIVFVEQQSKLPDQTFETWYANEVGGNPSGLKESLTKEGYLMYMGQDELVSYVVFDDVVFVFTYDLGESTTIDYLQTFQMIVNSFVYLPDEE